LLLIGGANNEGTRADHHMAAGPKDISG
jgi:hypothetical protein